ncbi:MAG: methionine gamma-lyase family protein [Clostridia bacterium]|nr:methionine gamma-lyase family protein [Clostridia bacterium]
MNDRIKNEMLFNEFNIKEEAFKIINEAEEELKDKFKEIDDISEYNQYKVIRALQKNRVSEMHLNGTTGYGYNDTGRDTIEKVYADIFKTEDALVRLNMLCGTHALKVALFGNLKCGDEVLFPAGKPYDTLDSTIGINGAKGSLVDYGITYKIVPLNEDESFNYDEIKKAINEKTKLVEIQRSRGYDTRATFSVEQIGELIKFIKEVKSDIVVMVDNCYGELTDYIEPTEVGADFCVGSLIKNLGGGVAPCGGYIVGKKEYVENASYALNTPGLGKEIGASLGYNRSFLEGLFNAPGVVNAALKGAILTARVFEKLGYKVSPSSDAKRNDIVQQIYLNNADNVIKFCQAIQHSSPVDSHVSAEPWDMPGYDDPVIMAAGTFVQGSSIELSADAPIREPYVVYMQGGLNYEHVKLAILNAVNEMI